MAPDAAAPHNWYQRLPFFYGWIITVSALVMLWVTNGLTLGGLTVFDEVLLEELGVSRGRFKFRDTITLVGAGLLAPLVGAFVDRFGVRPAMIIGVLVIAWGLYDYSRVDSLMDVYRIHALFALGLACAGLLVNVMLVSKWFISGRGIAIGIALSGSSFGNALFPQLNTWLLEHEGWREAFTRISLLPFALLLLIVFVIRERPERVGLLQRGASPKNEKGTSAAADDGAENAGGMSYGEALRSLNFWILAIMGVASFYSIMACITHLFLYLRELGAATSMATSAISVVFLLGLAGKVGTGFGADFFGRRAMTLVTLGLMAGGAWLLLSGTGAPFWVGLAAFGFGWGGIYMLIQLLAADTFGLRALGRILGTLTVMESAAGGLGPWVTGLLYDASGGYQLPFMFLATLLSIALVAASRFRLPAAAVA
ncbi:MAG: MFS transporter [Gammaproteobacteria bacterium]|nr:MFS transporter [Gammaproteobacteria bacterium]NNM00066.1 MFS transporter [Gammaproteobacteria bacterium]